MKIKSRFAAMAMAALVSPFAMPTTMSAGGKNTVGVVSRPPVGTSINYKGFRAPLQCGRLIKLPIGSIKPKGWILRRLQLQRDGLNGHLGEISPWLDKNGNQWLSNKGDHGWEEVPYWLRGYCANAYILGDEAMEKEAQTWFEAVLRNQRADGFLGPQNTSNGKPEVWAQMIMLWALQTYYEHSGDERVLTAMKRYFQWEMRLRDSNFLKSYWEHQRGGDNEWSVIWYYNQTGDASVLPLIAKIHYNTADWTQPKTLPNWHGVNVAQGIREPPTYFLYAADSALIGDSYNDQKLMRQLYGQVPGGMYGADENARKGYADPRQGAELCAMVEQMASDEIMLGITGDPYWAANCEDVAFNTLPAAMMPDMCSLRYITSPNMAVSDGKNHAPSIDNAIPGMLSMTPFCSRCCQHNHGMGWPYYAQHLFMATNDNGLAAVLYGACSVTARVADGKKVTIDEETHYPFDETISLTIRTDGDTSFPLYLLIPHWAKGSSVAINGKEALAGAAPGNYAAIERTWKDGDKVTLRLPMTVSTRTWQANKGSMSVDYGPLTLSLKIKENYRKYAGNDSTFMQGDSHWREDADASKWPGYEIFAASPWNYSLAIGNDGMPLKLEIKHGKWPADNDPFTQATVPLSAKAYGQLIPSWGFDSTGMTGVLPGKDASLDNRMRKIELIPMGAARLRISAFPCHKIEH